MIEYIYLNKSIEPNLSTTDEEGNIISGIHYDVPNSDMEDKSLDWCRWDEDLAQIIVVFENELSSEDKTKLDTIVDNNS